MILTATRYASPESFDSASSNRLLKRSQQTTDVAFLLGDDGEMVPMPVDVSSVRRVLASEDVEMERSRMLQGLPEPTDRDQYMMELVNRARLDPQGEADLYLDGDLNEGLRPGTISTQPKQPLAWHLNLQKAARDHGVWMLQNGVFDHRGAGGSGPIDRFEAAGYQWSGTIRAGENLAWDGTNRDPDYELYVRRNNMWLFQDFPIPSRGHRLDMMNSIFMEAGISNPLGSFRNGNTVFRNSMMTVQNFAMTRRNGQFYITGVAYTDAIVDDDFYSMGEGIGGITVTAVDVNNPANSFSTTTMQAGGYMILVPGNAEYTVTFSGDLKNDGSMIVASFQVSVDEQNVKQDVVSDKLSEDPSIPTWGSWSSWSQCNADCEGTQTRTRECIGGTTCIGTDTETQICGGNCPSAGVWGQWSEWSCSMTCGAGVQTRTRSCITSGCVGNGLETGQCSEGDCPIVPGGDVEYIMLGNGEVCPDEASLIRSESECLDALGFLGIDTNKAPWYGYKANKKPAGCSYRTQNDKLHFNTYLAGVGQGKNGHFPICKVEQIENFKLPIASYTGFEFFDNSWGYLSHCFDGEYGEGRSQKNYVCHSESMESPWIEINLPQAYMISSIKIWNRWGCCQDRLGLHEWYVDGTLCHSSVADSTFEIEDSCQMQGSTVRLVLPGQSRTINLQEIEIFGSFTDATITEPTIISTEPVEPKPIVPDVNCVVDEIESAKTCSEACGEVPTIVSTEKSGNGADCPTTYVCRSGDGACSGAQCRVGDMMYSDGDMTGYIGTTCHTNDFTFDSLDSYCRDGEIVQIVGEQICPDLTPFCCQVDGSALCLSDSRSCDDRKEPESQDCAWVPASESDCPSFSTASSMANCHVFMAPGELCEADSVLPDGNQNFNINNCEGGFDVFRYTCSGIEPEDEDLQTDGEFQYIGSGLCRSSYNSSVRGKVHLSKTDAQCREECESSTSCFGYSATVAGSGTCYVYGQFGRNLSNGWSESSGFGTEVTLANGLESMNCYKLL